MQDQKNIKLAIASAFCIICGLLLFCQLGTYALWDDEATTALFGQSVWRTGDTSAQIGHNIIAYNSGVELQDMRNRFIPPLAFYLAAPFVGLHPGSAFAARFPFSLCGLVTVFLMIRWLWRSRARLSIWLLTVCGVVGNVSFFLYFRQCRYYGPVILLTMALAYLYYFRDTRRKWYIGFSICALLLLAANYLCYVAVMVCFLTDYVLWGRKKHQVNLRTVVTFIGIQLIFGGLLVSFYNPIGKSIWEPSGQVWIWERLNLFWWHIRDLNRCEFGVGIFLLVAPFVAYAKSDQRLMRCCMAFYVYLLVVSALSPQPLNLLSVAFVRYLVPLIPVCIFIAVILIDHLIKHSRILAIIVAFLAFGTNILHGGPLSGTDSKTVFSHVISQGKIRSTIWEFFHELYAPPPSAYRATANWIEENVKLSQSIWISPVYATYPLLYHAHKPLYAWQLDKYEDQFKGLPAIHYLGKEAPDYMIAFGPHIYTVEDAIKQWSKQGQSYKRIKTIDRYWYDLTRPELFWHTFRQIKHYRPASQAIYIYQKQ